MFRLRTATPRGLDTGIITRNSETGIRFFSGVEGTPTIVYTDSRRKIDGYTAMAFHVRDPETDALVRQLANEEGVGLTEAVKIAVSERLDARRRRVALHERIKEITRKIASMPETGPKADKAFFDDLSGL
jgi:antitoxin VapB